MVCTASAPVLDPTDEGLIGSQSDDLLERDTRPKGEKWPESSQSLHTTALFSYSTAENPFYTKRFGFYISKRCRSSSISEVAKEFHLDWRTVKNIEMDYMRHLLERAPKARPGVIGIDEISIKKGHTYRIVVSDLERRRPIWFGGKDRSEVSMNLFYEWIGPV
jgi:hypothetical protein